MGRRICWENIVYVLLPVHLACSPSVTSQNHANSPAETATAAPSSAETGSPEPTGPRADLLYAAHPAVPAPPASCVAGTALPAQHQCADARGDLAAALALEGEPRDRALQELEACDAFQPGLIRALRADLASAVCADLLVLPVVGDAAKIPANVPHDLREALVGLGLAARLARLAGTPPAPPKARDKDTLDLYYKEQLFPWIEAQAGAIYTMASQGKELRGYGRGLVAIEAGNADMRFVEIARDAPIAKEIESYPEARDLYYATLDERLEPRKARGSAAALVGMREFAQLGIRASERIASARALLSRAYGGRRVNALDTLLLPNLPAEKATDAASAIASQVPTVYASALVGTPPITAELTRAHMQMGMPTGLRRAVEAGEGGSLSQLYLARALFESGRTYFRAQDFQDTNHILNRLLDGDANNSLSAEQLEHAILLRALSVALLAGPKDAAEMIAQGPRFAEALGNLVPLDGLAAGTSEQAGRAAFNSAYLRELVIKPADPAAWAALSQAYDRAARQLKGDEARRAKDRARACQDIEKTVKAELARTPAEAR